MEVQDLCSICLESATFKNKDLSILPCNHKFHHDCIATWWKKVKYKSCPYCKASFDGGTGILYEQIDDYIIKGVINKIFVSGYDKDLYNQIEEWKKNNSPPLIKTLETWKYYIFISYVRLAETPELFIIIKARIRVLLKRGFIRLTKNNTYTCY